MKRHIIIALAAVSLASSASADVYEQVDRQVVENSPALKALRMEQMADIMTRRAENRLDDPEVEFGRLWAPSGVEPRWDLSVSQSFNLPMVYTRRNQELKSRIEANELTLKAEAIAKMVEARSILLEIAYINRSLDLEKRIRENLSQVQTLMEKAFQNGQISILELNKSRIETANNVAKVRELETAWSDAVARLSATGVELDKATMQSLGYPVRKFESLEYYQDNVANDPLVSSYNALARAEALGSKVAATAALPKVSVGYVHQYEEGVSFNGFKVGMNLPFFSARGKRAIANSLTAAAEWKARAATIERLAAVNANYTAAKDRIELLEMLAPIFNTADHPALLFKAFKGGQLSAVEYLNEMNYFVNSERDFLQLELDCNKSLLELNKSLLGNSL